MSHPELLIVGHLNKAHGTKGEVFVWPLTDDADVVFRAGRELTLGDDEGLGDGQGERIVIERSRPFKRGYLLRLEGREDRTAVEPLAGRYVGMPVDALRPLEEGELFYHQLLGMRVETTDGTDVGRIREVYEMTPADMLEVDGPERAHLVPLVRDVVREVDVDGGRMVIEPPEGLLEL